MTYIIADIGSNFTTLQEAYLSIEAAAESGADMAKFQLFSEHDLYGDGSTERTLHNTMWLPHLAECCKQNEIDFGCTAFSPEGVALVDPFVQVHKVASSCVTHPTLLGAIGTTKKPVFMSVGACTEEEIEEAWHALLASDRITIMYCSAAYPSRMYNPHIIDTLQGMGPWRVGYSDHTTDIWGAVVHATFCKVSAIEKHFTAFPLLNSPDRPHSLTPPEFRMMVDAIRNGIPESIGPSPEEAEFVKYHKVRKTDRGYYRVRKP